MRLLNHSCGSFNPLAPHIQEKCSIHYMVVCCIACMASSQYSVSTYTAYFTCQFLHFIVLKCLHVPLAVCTLWFYQFALYSKEELPDPESHRSVSLPCEAHLLEPGLSLIWSLMSRSPLPCEAYLSPLLREANFLESSHSQVWSLQC